MTDKSSTEYVSYAPKRTKMWKAYCAIDVGAINCGYAYSFRDTNHIWENDNWADHMCYSSPRAPSALLYDSAHVPVAFGFDACEKYKLLSRKEVKEASFVYDGLLHHGEYVPEKTSSVRTSASDKPDVFTSCDDHTQQIREAVLNRYADLALLLGRHFKAHIEETYKRTPDKIVWSVVVPLSWDADCKSCYVRKIKELYLREFSKEFEAQRYKIKAITSTEALWLALRDDTKKLLKRGKVFVRKDKNKEKGAIFVHAGAIKTDISLHKKKTGRVPIATKSLEVGGHCVNKVFEQLMKESLASKEHALVELQDKYTSVWLELLLSFENVKDALVNGKIELDIDYAFSEALLKVTGKEVREVFREMGNGDNTLSGPVLVSRMGQLRPSIPRLLEKYRESAIAIVHAVNKLVKNNEVEVSVVALTGGFRACLFVKDHFMGEQEKNCMPVGKLQVPNPAAMLLARGAVLGAKEDSYKKLPNTFVVQWYHNMDEYKSYKKPLNTINGHKVLEKVYPILHKGQDIEVGKSFQIGPFNMNDCYQKDVWLDLYKVPRIMDKLGGPTSHWFEVDCIKEEEKIDKLRVTVPPVDYGKPLVVNLTVSLDLLGFKATMTLTSSPLAEKGYVVCRYT